MNSHHSCKRPALQTSTKNICQWSTNGGKRDSSHLCSCRIAFQPHYPAAPALDCPECPRAAGSSSCPGSPLSSAHHWTATGSWCPQWRMASTALLRSPGWTPLSPGRFQEMSPWRTAPHGTGWPAAWMPLCRWPSPQNHPPEWVHWSVSSRIFQEASFQPAFWWQKSQEGWF